MNPKFNPDRPACPPEEAIPGYRTVGESARCGERMVAHHPDLKKKKNDLLSVENLQDALTDFFHLCDREGLDVEELVAGAQANWVNERDPALDDEADAPTTTREAIDMIVEGRVNPPGNLQID